MAKIDYEIIPESGYEGDYNIEAYAQSAPSVKVGETLEEYPHSNPMVGEIDVPSSVPYFVRVRAVDCDTIVSEFPAVPPVAECSSPGAVSISAITESTATASWGAASSAPAEGYDWRLVRIDGITEVAVTSGNTSGLSVALTGLISGNDYRFYVKSKCSSEVSSNESYATFHTTDPDPEPPDYDLYSRRFLLDGLPIGNICAVIEFTNFYVPFGATLEPGVILYANAGLADRLTGYAYVLLDDSNIYSIDPVTGEVGALTGQSC